MSTDIGEFGQVKLVSLINPPHYRLGTVPYPIMQFDTSRLYTKQQPFKSNLFRPRLIQGHSVTLQRHRVSEQFHCQCKEKKMFVKSQAIGVFVGFTVAFMASLVSIFIDISLIHLYGSHLLRVRLYLLIVSF